jgi:RNA polymerase sigma-70 factor, ECF subfamily
MGQDDNELVLMAQRGDNDAFEALVYRYDRRILGIAMRYVGDMDAAKDVYQEVFLRVYHGLSRFKFESRFSTWLYRIAVNTCLTHEASRRRRKHLSIEREVLGPNDGGNTSARRLPEQLVAPSSADRETVGGEIAERIRAALDRLSPQQRMVFILRHFEGHKLREIATLLSCAEGTVKKHLFSGTNRLREALADVYARG